MSGDEVPPDVVARIADNVFDEIRRLKRIDQAHARATFTVEAVEQAHFFLWTVELRSTE